MLFSGGEIQEAIESGHLVVEPFSANSIQPASIDLRLYPELQVCPIAPVRGITLDSELLNISEHINRYADREDISGSLSWRFQPGQFIIGQTLEMVEMPLDLAGWVEGRSRLARLGVGVHITAPKIDPGFRNRITLEMYNLGPWTIELSGGMKICTLLIERLGKPAETGYTGMFQGRDATGS